jgi:ATP-binding cassette, subfamily C, bacteriocin exporter
MHKFACVYAHDSRDCGPAALATVALHYGVNASLGALRSLAQVDSQGASLESLRVAAETIGFSASCGKAKTDLFDKLPLPAIAHWGDLAKGHFVVLHSIRKDTIVVADPATGVERLSRSVFHSKWSGYVLLLSSPNRRLLNRTRRRSSKYKLLMSFLNSEKPRLCKQGIMMLFVALAAFIIPTLLQRLIDHSMPAATLGIIYRYGVGLGCAVFAKGFFGLARSSLLSSVGREIQNRIVGDYWAHLLRLPIIYFERRLPGDIVSVVFDASSISTVLSNTVMELLFDILFVLMSLAWLVRYSPSLSCTLLASVPLTVAIYAAYHHSLIKKEREVKELLSDVTSHMVDTACSIRTLKMCGLETSWCSKLLARYKQMLSTSHKAKLMASTANSIGNTINGLLLTVLIMIGTYLISQNRLTVGQLILFYSIAGVFMGSIEKISPSVISFHEALIGAERFSDCMETPAEVYHPADLKHRYSHSGSLVIKELSFSYRTEREVLSEFNISIEQGETIAIIGDTGCGKSTLAALLCGLYDPDKGSIKIGSVDFKAIGKDAVRKTVSVVFQDGGLFAGSILDNIRAGCEAASDEEIHQAARMACAHEFIINQPGGYNSYLGSSGIGLSTGQRQRIALARVILRQSPVLILDEATSNLDFSTEDQVLSNLLRLRRGLTTIIITHRPATARRADRIVRMSGGRLMYESNHADAEAMHARTEGNDVSSRD